MLEQGLVVVHGASHLFKAAQIHRDWWCHAPKLRYVDGSTAWKGSIDGVGCLAGYAPDV